MEQLPGLATNAFRKADPAPDADFYRFPRFVTHIDDAAIAAVTDAYRRHLPPDGAILDVMSSWVSHLPADGTYAQVVGHGMNEEELAANPRLARWFVQDLNADPVLPLETNSFDGACICVSVQYLQRPVELFRDLARALRTGAPLVITFSNRCFPTKAVAIWQALSGPAQQQLVSAYLEAAGFRGIVRESHEPAGGDPLFLVIGHAP
jgi:SAM-dependent methyltransferase